MIQKSFFANPQANQCSRRFYGRHWVKAGCTRLPSDSGHQPDGSPHSGTRNGIDHSWIRTPWITVLSEQLVLIIIKFEILNTYNHRSLNYICILVPNFLILAKIRLEQTHFRISNMTNFSFFFSNSINCNLLSSRTARKWIIDSAL